MTQRDLLSYVAPRVGAGVRVPSVAGSGTSRAAASAIKSSAGTLRGIVLDYIRARGEMGATDEEIQEGIPMAPNTQRPRRVELCTLGLIVEAGTRATRSGRQAVVWQVANNDTGDSK